MNMKTIDDLFDLVLEQTNKNKGKMVRYMFDISQRYNWVSMTQVVELSGEKKEKEIFSNMSIATPEELQLVYWTIVNKGRK
jgi:hypothetical protein